MATLNARSRIALTVCAAAAMCCTARQVPVAAQASPSAAMHAYHDAAKKRDGAALKALVSAGTVKALENPGVPVERALLAMTEGVPDTRPEIRNEKIDGNRATLEVRNVQTSEWEKVIFVKENGAWKIALDEMDKERKR